MKQLTRLGFMRLLAGAPIIGALASMGFPMEATEDGTPPPFEIPSIDGEPSFTAYGKEFAGDWSGYVTAADNSWVTFIDKFGHAVRLDQVTHELAGTPR